MLFNYLVEIQESTVNGKGCFVAIAAKHSTEEIEKGATLFGIEKRKEQSDYSSSIGAVAGYIESDKKKDSTLVASNVSINFFNEDEKDEVFYKSLAKACFWLMDMSVNTGLNSTLSKIVLLGEHGGQRKFEGFASFVETGTNKASNKVIADIMNEMATSETARNEVLERTLAKAGKNERLVLLDTSTIDASKRTIRDMIALSLFAAPCKTQDMSQTVEWFNEKHVKLNNDKRLNWTKEYQSLIVDTGRSIFSVIKSEGITTDVENLFAEVGVAHTVSIMKKLEKAVLFCSASELLWSVIVKAEEA